MAHSKTHTYTIEMEWTGNTGAGTTDYRSYERSHVIRAPGKQDIAGSSDPVFRGDRTKYNPEDMLVSALSSCHMLAYLHLCAVSKIVVEAYVDDAVGTMEETPNGGGRFTEVVLRPRVGVRKGADVHLAQELHEKAHELCFIASSVNFPVRCEPKIEEL